MPLPIKLRTQPAQTGDPQTPRWLNRVPFRVFLLHGPHGGAGVDSQLPTIIRRAALRAIGLPVFLVLLVRSIFAALLLHKLGHVLFGRPVGFRETRDTDDTRNTRDTNNTCGNRETGDTLDTAWMRAQVPSRRQSCGSLKIALSSLGPDHVHGRPQPALLYSRYNFT